MKPSVAGSAKSLEQFQSLVILLILKAGLLLLLKFRHEELNVFGLLR